MTESKNFKNFSMVSVTGKAQGWDQQVGMGKASLGFPDKILEIGFPDKIKLPIKYQIAFYISMSQTLCGAHWH